MTKEQFNEIKERLAKWRKDRHLTYENQKEGFLGNVFEEVSEYFRAKYDLGKIDSICDISILCFNAFDVNYINYYNSKSLKLTHIITHIALAGYKIEENINTTETIESIIQNLGVVCENLGFDSYKCMIETIKQIESRTGKYDNDLKKFVKDKGAYTKKEAQKKYLGFCFRQNKDYYYLITITGFKKIKKWYKADYESCRI